MNEKRGSKPVDFEANLTPEETQLLQAWLAAPAPGEEALTGLAVPRPRIVAQPSRRRWGRTIAQHCATGALLFVVGFAAGHWRDGAVDKAEGQRIIASDSDQTVKQQTRKPADDVAETTNQPADTARASESTASDKPAGTASASPDKMLADAASPAPPVAAPSARASTECKSPEIYQGKDGHFRIDTVLCQSGSRATWVINPRLEIANAVQSSSMETK